jgi:hypothetical protein
MGSQSIQPVVQRFVKIVMLALLISACTSSDGHNQRLSTALSQCRPLIAGLDRVVHDDRQVLFIGGKGSYATFAEITERRILVEAASTCILQRLDAPEDLIILVRDTTRSDGMRIAEWGTFRVVWQESRRSGLDVAIGRRGATTRDKIDIEYP